MQLSLRCLYMRHIRLEIFVSGHRKVQRPTLPSNNFITELINPFPFVGGDQLETKTHPALLANHEETILTRHKKYLFC